MNIKKIGSNENLKCTKSTCYIHQLKFHLAYVCAEHKKPEVINSQQGQTNQEQEDLVVSFHINVIQTKSLQNRSLPINGVLSTYSANCS